MLQKNLLMVDDDTIFHEIISEILEPHNYIVSHAYDGEEGIKAFEDNSNIDIILSDVMMPKVDGLELLSHIRSSNRSDIPIVMMTSHIKNEYILQALRSGASDFIGKKIDEISLLNTLNRQLNIVTKLKQESFLANHLIKTDMTFTLTASDYLNTQNSLSMLEKVRSVCNLDSGIFNNLVIVIDEILNNCFIHGIFKLTRKERFSTSEKHNKYIKKLLEKKEIRDRNLFLKFSLHKDKLDLVVKDFGDGFDFEKLKFSKNKILNFDPYGRGLNLIYLMTDEIVFSDKGSTISISKRLTVE